MKYKKTRLSSALQTDADGLAVSWPFVVVFTLMLLGNNIYNKITLLICLLYYAYSNFSKTSAILKGLRNGIWLVFLGLWAAASMFWTVVPVVTIDIIFTQAAFFILAVLMAYDALDKDIGKSIKIVALFVIFAIIAYAAIFPGASMSALGFRAFYPHKNNLGVALAICFIAIFYSQEKRWYEYIAAVIAVILLVFSGSKTSLSAIGAVLTLSFFIFAFRGVYMQLSKFAQGMLLLLSRAIPFILYIFIASCILYREDVVNYVISNLPYKFMTGRGELWVLVLSRSRNDLLTGLGPGTFWNAGTSSEVTKTYLYNKAPLWVDKLGSADGGYIDLLGTLGFVGFALLLMSFIANYKKLVQIADQPVAKLMLACITFFILHNITETTIFNSTNPLWFLYLFATFFLAFYKNRDVS